MKKHIFPRVALLLVLCLVVCSMVSCASSKTTLTHEVVYEETVEQGATLSAKQLNDIATWLCNANGKTVLVKNADGNDVKMTLNSNTMLIAAYRGYDMLDPAFDDAKLTDDGANVPAPAKTADTAAGIKLISKAEEAINDKLLFTYDTLNAADMLTVIKSMQSKVDLTSGKGIVATILGWVGAFLGILTRTVGFDSYIIGICIFAIIVEILLLPFAVKQQKNSIKQATLRPKEMAIRKKYAGRDDQATRQKVTQEIQELYQKENFNQFAGCLPLLLQFPIIIGLYQVVIDPLQYVLGQAAQMTSALSTFAGMARAAGGLGFGVNASRGSIELLAKIRESTGVLDGLKDFLFFSNTEEIYNSVSSVAGKIPNFMLGSLNLGEIPSFDGNKWLLLIPVVTFLVYFLSMRLTRKFTYQPTMAEDDKQVACSNTMMDFMMPLMSVYISFIVPALVGIYWIFKSVISTLRQFLMTLIMPYPKFTEEDYKAAEREYAGKAAKSGRAPTQNYNYGNRQMVGGKPKSLFHMDDDDYVAKVEEEARREEEAKATESTPTEKDTHGVSRASLKAEPKDKKKK